LNKEENSYRQILRSSFISGGSSVINILIGLLRTKAVAVILGPSGIGLIALFYSLMATASTIFSFGLGSVGTRQIAEVASKENSEYSVDDIRRALCWGTFVLAVVATLAFWLLREVLASEILNEKERADQLGILAIGVGLMVISGSQSAVLNGLRRISDLAWLSIFSAIFSAFIGVAALLLWKERGVILFLLSGPIVSFLVANWFIRRLEPIQYAIVSGKKLVYQWKKMLNLGAAFMLSALITTSSQLLIRTLVQRELGSESLGYFQAAWVISGTYIGFVLAAMGTDYYPRLTSIMHDFTLTNRLVNEQTEVALLLAGPVFLAMIGMAPYLIELLYSKEFIEAASILQWQVLGDILKVASWPIGFIILAAGDGRTFVITELIATAIFTLVVWVGLPLIGIKATGIGFLIMYIVHLPLMYFLAWKRTGFEFDKIILFQFSILFFLACLIFIASIWSSYFALITGVIFSMIHVGYTIIRFGKVMILKNFFLKVL